LVSRAGLEKVRGERDRRQGRKGGRRGRRGGLGEGGGRGEKGRKGGRKYRGGSVFGLCGEKQRKDLPGFEESLLRTLPRFFGVEQFCEVAQ
jgi:hypothetical protein